MFHNLKHFFISGNLSADLTELPLLVLIFLPEFLPCFFLICKFQIDLYKFCFFRNFLNDDLRILAAEILSISAQAASFCKKLHRCSV